MTYDDNGKMIRMVEDNGTPNATSDDEISTFTYDKGVWGATLSQGAK